MGGTTSVAFTLRSCGHASVYLAEIPGVYASSRAYEVVLGSGDAKDGVQIKNGGMVVMETTIAGVTSCTAFKNYVLSWNNGTIVVGTGIPTHLLSMLSWTDPDPRPINAVAFTTANGNIGEWQFNTVHGEFLIGLHLLQLEQF